MEAFILLEVKLSPLGSYSFQKTLLGEGLSDPMFSVRVFFCYPVQIFWLDTSISALRSITVLAQRRGEITEISIGSYFSWI